MPIKETGYLDMQWCRQELRSTYHDMAPIYAKLQNRDCINGWHFHGYISFKQKRTLDQYNKELYLQMKRGAI